MGARRLCTALQVRSGSTLLVLLLAGSRVSLAQGRYLTVTGTVRDPAGNSISAAAVSALGVKAATDSSGDFQISVARQPRVTIHVAKEGYLRSLLSVTVPDSTRHSMALGIVTLRRAILRQANLRFVVTDLKAGTPVDSAVIVLDDSIRVRSGRDGTAVVDGVRVYVGPNRLVVRRIGYGPVDTYVDLIPQPGGNLQLGVKLSALALDLPEVVVEGAPLTRSPWLNGFEHRRKIGFGSFLTEDRIRHLAVPTVADLLPWVGASVSGGGSHAIVRLYGALCSPPVFFIDGVWLTYEGAMEYLDAMNPMDVTGIETYARIGGVPPEFDIVGAACGVVVIWTRSGAR